ncbi:hypothetical protein DSO57_1005734 [Entomophthora muscae]|uniref:Uncharacterized protein n=1 Tax=Entomophthora muscae TaxID=34485 RepID=A0ACC2T854_9FUNG|nr:hypothetical protein DSO57_1005734 [Entomophthora muscae]
MTMNLITSMWKNMNPNDPKKTNTTDANVTEIPVTTEVQTSPANVSYNTQGALDESPLDVSNVMNESDDNVKWQALHPN